MKPTWQLFCMVRKLYRNAIRVASESGAGLVPMAFSEKALPNQLGDSGEVLLTQFRT